jgi:putative nucleotidyltransferase with HDIG domain
MTGGLQAARSVLAGESAWLVGGAVRDRALGRGSVDFDVIVAGDPERAARAVAREAGKAACFALSQEFGAWRVVARDGSWQLDVEPLRGGALEADLAMRDFTVNAIAEPLDGGEPIDPLDGMRDLRRRTLRMTGEGAFAADPLRVLRLVRVAVELGLEPEPQTLASARANAAGLAAVSAERVFAELCRIIAAATPRRGIELMSGVGATAVVLPELERLRGVEQNRFHHLDVHDHTLEVLDRATDITAADWPRSEPARRLLESRWPVVSARLAEPFADGLTRGQALRWGALLHDAAKPLTREMRAPDGRVTFIGHDVRGAELARATLTRLRASERLCAHVASLTRHHLRLGFLVHEPQPLDPRSLFGYLRTCAPVELDVTLLSVADRLATRGEHAEESIERHLALAAQVLDAAIEWHVEGPPRQLIRGDELARELGIAEGPRLGRLLEELAAAQYAGEISTAEQALAYARGLDETI